MIDPVCHGLGWPCENHPYLARTNDPVGCQCGAGMLCGCNRSDDIDAGIEEPDVGCVAVVSSASLRRP